MKTSLLGTIAIAGALAMGCAEEPVVIPAQPPAVPDKASAPVPDDKDPNKANVVVDPRIQELCDVPVAYFAFDSAALGADARRALDLLATCFKSGKAKGKNMRIVGHADPRGTVEYNFALGQRRAGSVAEHLTARGLGEDRIETSSRGELEATGSDPEGWARDRKVEILLAN